jgi:hypothetical protein
MHAEAEDSLMLAVVLGFIQVVLSIFLLFIIIQKAFSLFLFSIVGVILLFVWLRKTGRLFFASDYICAMEIFAYGAAEPELCLELGWGPRRARRMLDILVQRGWIEADISTTEGPWMIYRPTVERWADLLAQRKLSGNGLPPSKG